MAKKPNKKSTQANKGNVTPHSAPTNTNEQKKGVQKKELPPIPPVPKKGGNAGVKTGADQSVSSQKNSSTTNNSPATQSAPVKNVSQASSGNTAKPAETNTAAPKPKPPIIHGTAKPAAQSTATSGTPTALKGNTAQKQNSNNSAGVSQKNNMSPKPASGASSTPKPPQGKQAPVVSSQSTPAVGAEVKNGSDEKKSGIFASFTKKGEKKAEKQKVEQKTEPQFTSASHEPQSQSRTKSSEVRRARMTIQRVEPLSVAKVGFLLSFAMGIMIVVAMFILWLVLDSMQVLGQLNSLFETLNSEQLLTIAAYLGFGRWMSFAVIIAIIDIVLMTGLAVVGAYVYNTIASLVGGVRISVIDV